MAKLHERGFMGTFRRSGDRKKGKKETKSPETVDTERAPGIAERVRFWEEQDRINEVLIPKVIRQHELLTNYIQEHEDLHERFRREIAAAQEKQARYLRAWRWLVIVALVCALVSVGALVGSAVSMGPS